MQSKGRSMHQAALEGTYFIMEWTDDDGQKHTADYPAAESIAEVALWAWCDSRIPACTSRIEFWRVLPQSSIGCRFLDDQTVFVRA